MLARVVLHHMHVPGVVTSARRQRDDPVPPGHPHVRHAEDVGQVAREVVDHRPLRDLGERDGLLALGQQGRLDQPDATEVNLVRQPGDVRADDLVAGGLLPPVAEEGVPLDQPEQRTDA